MPTKARRDAARRRKQQQEQESQQQGQTGASEPARTGEPGTEREQLPTDTDVPSATDDVTNPDVARPTAREGLKPVGTERPHPTAAARPGKTAGQAGLPAPQAAATRAREKREQSGRIKVRATAMGYYDNTRRRTGDVFTISDETYEAPHPRAGDLVEFSENWMEMIDGSVPERTTTSQQAVDQQTQELRNARRANAAAVQTGVDRDDVPPQRTGSNRNPLG